MWQAYEFPQAVDEAIQILSRYEGRARLIAGGTDLVIQLNEGQAHAECLVDVTRIPGLDRIEADDDRLLLGCNVTFRQIKDSPLLRQRATVLSEAAATVGALQIQNVATMAGNVVNAMPAADGSVALVALDAEVEVADAQGRAWRPIESVFAGPGRSAVDPTRQMLTAIRFGALGAGQGSAWERIGRRRALVLPIVNCAVCVALDPTGSRLEWARIALGPVAPVPFRARGAESLLAGKPAAVEAFAEAARLAAGECNPRSSLLRASREYRLEVLQVLIRRGLERAAQRARERHP